MGRKTTSKQKPVNSKNSNQDELLLNILTQGYLDSNPSVDAEIIGKEYSNQLMKRLQKKSPELKPEWDEFLKTPAGERHIEWMTDAGILLSLMDVRRKIWDTRYQDLMEIEKNKNYDQLPLKPYVLSSAGLKFKRFLTTVKILAFLSIVAFLTVTVLWFLGFVISTAPLLALLLAVTTTAIWFVVRKRWNRSFGKDIRNHAEKDAANKLIWEAKFGAVPKYSSKTKNWILPACPFSWADDKEDLKEYSKVKEYFTAKYVTPYTEQSMPELVLPETGVVPLPVKELTVLREQFRKQTA